ncbi:MAG: TIGR02147 family protein [Proteobacteria bacterium]|nr:MAG: TIGR02147 family protein [Pseudomonadota bacterium]
MKHPFVARLLAAKDYRSFLRQVVEEEGKERGYRKRLADEAGCQAAYLSQILKGNVELTPEQADRLTVFWKMGEQESEIFLTLVMLGRAGSPGLKQRLGAKLEALKAQWRQRDATFLQPELSASDRALLYYSRWTYTAVHVLLTVPGLRTADALAKHLGLEKAEISEALGRLEKIELIEKDGNKWKVKTMNLHAPQGAVAADIHHRNWRVRALGISETAKTSAVRYTSVHTLSKEDLVRVREIMDKAIRETRRVIEPSPEEVGACLMVDYFELG